MPRFRRQQFLLALINGAGSPLSRTDVQKLLFLVLQRSTSPYYDFVPYKFGCYSFQADEDIKTLTEHGWLSVHHDNNIYLKNMPTTSLHQNEIDDLNKCLFHLKGLRGNKLVKYVYERYPYYAISSEIASKILGSCSYKKIQKKKDSLKHTDTALFTIGYENRSFESYSNQLIKHDVRLLCDVRKNPLSRKPGFSKGLLSRRLDKLDIDYIHLPDLGIPSEKRRSLETPQDYENLFRDYRSGLMEQNTSLELLYDMLKKYQRIVLTCFEREAHYCHRHCVSDYIENKYKQIRVSHL